MFEEKLFCKEGDFILLAEEMGGAAIRHSENFSFTGNTDCEEGSWESWETGESLREMWKMSLERKISFV